VPPGLSAVPNLRDLGGWPTEDGRRVVRGQVYRSDRLSRLAPADLNAFAALGIGTVYDLRTQDELTADPDVLPAGIERVQLDVLADSGMSIPAHLLQLLNDPPAATEALHATAVSDLFDSAYRELITLPSARAGYRELFTGLARPGRPPALFHCTTGKDRTGWAAAALLLALGVCEADVRSDYLRTNELLVPALAPLFDAFDAAGGDHRVLLPVLGVQQQYLDTALVHMTATFGSLEGYFDDGLELPSGTIDRLRSALTESAGR
jgi:protein-tyrosine phosphatase